MQVFDLPPNVAGEPEERQKPPPILERLGLSTLNMAELIQLRSEIDAKVPVKALVDLNLERELVMQLVVVQNLQNETLADPGVPANQKAQTVNSAAATLQTLAKMQTEVYNSERLKRMEQALIETLQALPTEAQEAFLTAYEGAIANL